LTCDDPENIDFLQPEVAGWREVQNTFFIFLIAHIEPPGSLKLSFIFRQC